MAERTHAVVRTRTGAVLGVDWRAFQGLVPGYVAVEQVYPGDTIRRGRERLVVVSRGAGPLGSATTRVTVLTAAGAEIVFEYRSGQFVEVVALDAFASEGVTS